MDGGELREYALGKPGAWADQPWEGDHVAKVGAKIFAFLGDATRRREVRRDQGRGRRVADPLPGRRLRHGVHRPVGWNTLRLDGAIPDDELIEAVDTSYDLVVARLPKRERPQGWSAPRS